MGKPRVLILGANGQVGWELQHRLSPLGDIVATTRDGRYGLQLDVSDLSRTRDTLNEVGPDFIVNAAAYTAVDRAENEPDLAHRINAELPELLGEWSAIRRVPVIHFSTDYVFDGGKQDAYIEEDTPNPVSVYGRTKLAGDLALLELVPMAFIFRVSWVYAARGSNFLLTMLRLMRQRESLGIVDDQWGAPTWAGDIAQTVAYVIHHMLLNPAIAEREKGLYHLSPSGETSWYGFAAAIREKTGLDCRLNPITTSDYPTAAARPANSRLNSEKLYRIFGLRLPHWEHSLSACLEQAVRPNQV